MHCRQRPQVTVGRRSADFGPPMQIGHAAHVAVLAHPEAGLERIDRTDDANLWLAVIGERNAEFRRVGHGEIGLGAPDDGDHYGFPSCGLD